MMAHLREQSFAMIAREQQQQVAVQALQVAAARNTFNTMPAFTAQQSGTLATEKQVVSNTGKVYAKQNSGVLTNTNSNKLNPRKAPHVTSQINIKGSSVVSVSPEEKAPLSNNNPNIQKQVSLKQLKKPESDSKNDENGESSSSLPLTVPDN